MFLTNIKIHYTNKFILVQCLPENLLTVIHYHGEKCKDFKINVIVTWKY